VRVGLNGLFLGEPHTGMGRHLAELLWALDARAAWSECYVVLGPRLRGDQSAPPRQPFRRISTTHASMAPRPLPAAPAKLWWEQIGVVRAGRHAGIDVLHTPYWANPLLTPWPTVVTVHDVIQYVLPEYRSGPRSRLYFALGVRGLRRATAIITVSECSRRDMVRMLGVPADQIRVIENAVGGHLRPVRTPDALERVRRAYGLPDRFVLYLGANDRRKNLDRLIRAYASLPRTVRDEYGLVIAGRQWPGDTPLHPDPARVVAELGLTDRVALTGGVAEEDKAALLSAATVFAFPSLYEGFGLPVLEAMACGTPVLTSSTSSLPEVVGDAGVLVDPTDIGAIAAALADLLADAERRDDLATRALERAARYSWPAVAERTVAQYRRAFDGAQDTVAAPRHVSPP